ncbi:MAG: ABC transporter permease [Gemmatimonadota bacterium]|nr:ABC transporter permease [Gemmatimonadota bacterium]
MIRNYLTVALRNLLRQPVYSLINVVGLAIGMAACMLIVLYIQDELSYDGYHPDADRIYRIVDDIESGGQTIQTAGSPLSWAPALKRDYPEVEQFVRMRGTGTTWLFKVGESHFYEKKVVWAEDGLFDLFDIPLVAGDPETALAEPFTIVISEEMAAKYFGREEAMGQIMGVDNTLEFRVTGIMRDLPANTHLRPDMFTSYSSLPSFGSFYRENWEVHDNLYTYILLRENANPDDLEARFPDFLERYAGDKYRESGVVLRPSLQPLVDIHLHSQRESELEPNGDIRFVVLYTLIACLIPLIACINFVNLATARSAMRAREVGVRKVMGANRTQLLGQFLGEAVVMASLAMIVSVILVQLALPAVNAIAGKQLFFPLSNGLVLAVLVFGAILIGLAAGSYPAVYLSAFLPTEVLKGNPDTGGRGLSLRKILVVVQFAMSIFLLVSTAVIYDQLEYISNKRLGFKKEQVMVLPITGSLQRRNTPALKERLSQLPGVVGVATTNGVPGMRVIPIMAVRPEGMAPEDHLMMATLEVDEHFLDVMEIELVAGRNFSPDWGTDSTTGFLLNETAVRYLGWGAPLDAIGKQFEWIPFGGARGRVIGVVKDFHLRTIHDEIEPVVMLSHLYHQYVLIRIEPGGIPETITRIGETWRNVDAGFPLEYTFLDEDFDRLYQDDRRLGEVFAIFAVLGVFVACLGLLGLASYSIQQRTREIGIRKVLGSSVSTIVVLLSKDFMKYVLLGNLIAWPLAYVVMTRWLQNYAYAADLNYAWFVAGGVVALVIAWLTIGAHAVAASRRNPVNALRQG